VISFIQKAFQIQSLATILLQHLMYLIHQEIPAIAAVTVLKRYPSVLGNDILANFLDVR